MDHLTQDPGFTAATFIVIDFETTTPAGYRPEPIEVAAVWLTVQDGALGRDGRSFQALTARPRTLPSRRSMPTRLASWPR
jgi:DNA polymerase-3 subunit epsilon